MKRAWIMMLGMVLLAGAIACVLTGKIRSRGGITYMNADPNLFWTMIVLISISGTGLVAFAWRWNNPKNGKDEN